MPPLAKKQIQPRISLSKKNKRGFLLLIMGVSLYWIVSQFLYVSPKSLAQNNSYKILHIKYLNSFDSIKSNKSKRLEKPGYNKLVWQTPNGEKKVVGITQKIDLNLADSQALDKLPGIGPVLSARIIKYRNKLGGFHSIEQLKEVYGLPDSTYDKISLHLKFTGKLVDKIYLNSVDIKTMAMHPYIGWENAKMIIRYRNSHGLFNDAVELESIWGLEKKKISRLLPYLSFDSTLTSK